MRQAKERSDAEAWPEPCSCTRTRVGLLLAWVCLLGLLLCADALFSPPFPPVMLGEDVRVVQVCGGGECRR